MEGGEIDWEAVKGMAPYVRRLHDGRIEASVGTGFETLWWPAATGATEEEAISNLNKILEKI